jgi:hypothetical protein
VVVVVMVAVIATLVGCGSGAPHRASRAAVTFPDTPAGRQARWLVGAVPHAPISAAEIAAHFDRAFLVRVSSVAALNASFEQVHRLRVDSITSSTPDTLAFVITVNGTTKLLIEMAVDARGWIDALDRQPAGVALLRPPPGVREIHVGVGSPPLQGTLTLPPGRGQFPAVVLVSGSGANDQNETVGPNHPFLDIAVGLAARGIATLRYDKRTRDYPHSIDPVTITPTQEYVPDALEAIHLLEHQPVVNRHQIFVLGHSQGGTYAPLIASVVSRK